MENVNAAMNECADDGRSEGGADEMRQYECEWEMIRGKGMIN